MEPDAEDLPPTVNPVPFLVALAAFAVVAVLAFVFLRADDDLTTVRPDRVEALDVATDDFVEAVARDRPGCERLERAQVDLDRETIFVELVVTADEGCVEAPEQDLVATLELPEPIDGRRVVPGLGRFRLPCDADGHCRPER